MSYYSNDFNRITCVLSKTYMHYIYVSKSCAKRHLEAIVFMFMMRLTFTKFAQEQLYYSHVFKRRIE